MRKIGLGITRFGRDSPRREERGHGRIDHVLIRAGDLEPALVHRDRRTRHRGAADPDEMDAFEIREHGQRVRITAPLGKNSSAGRAD